MFTVTAKSIVGRPGRAASCLLIDHHDSFTNNVRDWLLAGGFRDVQVVAYDALPSLSVTGIDRFGALVFSPGPKDPKSIAPSRKLMSKYIGSVPILGICLGHQLLAELLGCVVLPTPHARHGMTRQVYASVGHALFAGLPSPFPAASYNSLNVYHRVDRAQGGGDPSAGSLRVIAVCDQGEIQAIDASTGAPCLGVQFHPESFLTPDGQAMALNFREIVAGFWENA